MSFIMNTPGRDQPPTYVRQERLTREGLALLQKQEQMMTMALGGVLPEQPEPHRFESVLDVGSGTGQWLIDMAKAYPEIPSLVGVDISAKQVEYAQAQAMEQHVADRVQFRVMDALGFLDFPSDTFDLVNQRLGGSFLRTWEWGSLLDNFRRIAQTGGVIRLTEADMMETNSPAMMRRRDMVLQAFYQSGHSFSPQVDGLTRELAPLLRQQRFLDVQTCVHTLHYREGTVEGELLTNSLKLWPRVIQQFVQRWVRAPEGDNGLTYEQVSEDMSKPDFTATWRILTAWGTNPSKD